MHDKFLIRLDDDVIALRYNLETGEAMMGGIYRMRENIELIIEDYFGTLPPFPRFPQRRKVRYNFKLKKRVYDQGLKSLRESGVIEPVRDFGRIVR